MAKEQRSISNSISSDANWRTWGSTISDLWQDVGLTKTADTGQIDWTTATRPTSTGFAGYEIFTLDTDTEHASFPLYLRVDYGVRTGSGTPPWQRLGFQVGSGTNGAGTLTGQVGTQRIMAATGTAANDTTSQNHFCSSGDGYFAWGSSWNATIGTNSNALWNAFVVIERLRDNTGAVTDNGVYMVTSGMASADCGAQITRSDDINPAYTTPSSSSFRMGAYVPNMSGNRGTDLYLFSHQPADYALYNPCLSHIFYNNADLTAGIDINVDMYGTSRTYKPLGINGSSGACSTAFGHSSSGFAMLWE